MTTFQAIILAIIEGLTEFLPVSSTGHMIIASSLMGIGEDNFVKLFEIVIQLGAILSVVILYFKRFFRSFDFYVKLVVAVIPALIFGALFNHKIKEMMGNPLIPATTFIVGGVILLFVDKWFNKVEVEEEKNINLPTALKIGFFQCLAMIPGVSRSGASIVGGMSMKLSRKAAAEFSFFLAVPTMLAATAKDILDYYKDGGFKGANLHQEISLLLIGSAVAFVVALLAIRSFITFLEKKGFQLFGVYRIIIGVVIIALYYSGHLGAFKG
ncbi:undecaprenyl-diphosphatase [Mucilaginibacter yixingensis]|uniref:Undecaprenyl-diphosphatase n=1 Tax=Mucilaginibacter yixingensis TaxID=1295612 RepID=A0A2T5J822_9SPHI|nr:undecaprenyl-diphosphate phosphatase [Mucilaginibacter yixingensis]PTQ95539.1 undecaprenyl-diphosphatase [Mucilaginibacter yixingensis]